MKSSVIIKNLEVAFGDFRIEIPSLEFGAGQICCLMGKSGSGKSTVLNSIAGFTEIRKGSISIGALELQNLPPEKRRVAFIFQKNSLFSHLSVQENVEFALRMQGVEKKVRAERALMWLEKLEIGSLKDRRIEALSRGEAQRAQIARALITGFPVLLLDEPFSCLDVSLRQRLREVIKKLVHETGVAALLVTHDPKDAEILSDQLHVIDQGKIIASGTYEELRKKKELDLN